jgi:hypothetical protein
MGFKCSGPTFCGKHVFVAKNPSSLFSSRLILFSIYAPGHIVIEPSVCPHYRIGIGGHLTVNRTKENNRIQSITIELKGPFALY